VLGEITLQKKRGELHGGSRVLRVAVDAYECHSPAE